MRCGYGQKVPVDVFTDFCRGICQQTQCLLKAGAAQGLFEEGRLFVIDDRAVITAQGVHVQEGIAVFLGIGSAHKLHSSLPGTRSRVGPSTSTRGPSTSTRSC